MARRKDPGPQSRLRRISVPGAIPGPHPGFVEPALATLKVAPPTGGGYVQEIKFDGYRLQAHMRGGLVSLWTRGGLNWTKRFPTIAAGLFHVPATELVMDGEVISANEQGAASFSFLQDDLSKSRYDRMVYYAFDLIHLDGYDLRPAPLIERKRALTDLLAAAKDIGPVLLSQHFEESAATIFGHACAMGLEGIVSKHRDAPYRSGRTEAWLKVKCVQVGRFEVVGYKTGATSLYLGKRNGSALLYAGKAGTGYTNTMILELAKLLKPITIANSPLSKKPKGKKIDAWVQPKYWAEVEYRDITADGLLRHVTFRGLYTDQWAKKPLVAKFK